MAHNTLNSGTVTEIGGGKALLNDTVYEVKSGKALSNGTVYNIEFEPELPAKKVLNDMTWEEIRIVSDAGQAENYFAVGDLKGVDFHGTVGELSLSATYYCMIIGINHNSELEGTNTIHFQFGCTALSGGKQIALVDSKYDKRVQDKGYFVMNPSGIGKNSGGWKSCYLREAIIPQFKNAMPLELQSVLKAVNKYTDNTGGGSGSKEANISATNDEIFLLSPYEVAAKSSSGNAHEPKYQKQYAWYANGNSAVRYKHSSTGSKVYWFLRSPCYDESTGFCQIKPDGSTSSSTSNWGRGISPAFCV